MENKCMPTAASFLVTEDCNLACTYCFELDGRNRSYMSKGVARQGLDFLSDNAVATGEGVFDAMIFGGEPLMNMEVVEEIFEYGIKLSNEKNVMFTSSIVTNATILTPEVKRVLGKYKNLANLSVQLSVDGIKEIHDMYRVTRAGKGSFDIIAKNIPEWKELFADCPDRLSLHGCSNKYSIPYLYENYIFFRETWDISRIWFMPIHSEEWTDDDVEIYKEQLNKIADYILDRSKKEGNYQEVINYAPIDRCLRHDVFPGAPCGAGKNFITITAEGDLYPCHQLYFNDPEQVTKMGNLDVGIDYDIVSLFHAYSNKDLSCSKLDPDCDAYHCYRCIGDNWTANGSILSVVDCLGPRCKMSKVERDVQLRVRKELDNMSLLNNNSENYAQGNNPLNPDCLCDCRSSDIQECQCTSTDKDETLALALTVILDKLDTIEKEQALILKKLL